MWMNKAFVAMLVVAFPALTQAQFVVHDDVIDLEVIPLNTHRDYRFKGLAISRDGTAAYLGSWDRKEVLSIDLKTSAVERFSSPFSGRLNALGTLIHDDRLYALLNEVDDAPNSAPLSALALFDIGTGTMLRAHTLSATPGKSRHHFNHVVVGPDRMAYISDTLHGAIYRVDLREPNAAPYLWVVEEALALIHGLALEPSHSVLFVTSYEEGLGRIDLNTGTYASFKNPDSRRNDGIRYHRGAIYGVGGNAVSRYRLNAEMTAIVDTQALIVNHPSFNDPRCIDIVGEVFYVLANIEHDPVQFRRQADAHGESQMDTSILRFSVR